MKGWWRKPIFKFCFDERLFLLIPVISSIGKPLMPTSPGRARRLLDSSKAIAFWSRGLFCIRLKYRDDGDVQVVAVGIDPGSKKEAFTVKSKSHTYLNIQSDAVIWVKGRMVVRRNMRRSRRYRKTPYRANRSNRKKMITLAPSTKSRWQIKINIGKWLFRLYPITIWIIEDVKAKSRPGKDNNWNKGFSPLAAGKKWFYDELGKLGQVVLKQGYETCKMREKLGLKKSINKLSNEFNAHCVDSWVLANSYVGGHDKPDNKSILLVTPIPLHRRQLHRINPSIGGLRHRYGGTKSLCFKRGSLVKHKKYGLVYIGGTTLTKVSLHSIDTAKVICRRAKLEEITFICYNQWRNRLCLDMI